MDDVVTVLPDGRIEVANPVVLPDPLDMLIVGAGPAGTAAAFRAKELGLSALVIEIDDVLKRIRDYDAEKPIKPDFGAGRQMGFPKAGDFIERLHFFADIKSGEMCRSWKQLYRDHSVPAQVGVELVGLGARTPRRVGGRWCATTGPRPMVRSARDTWCWRSGPGCRVGSTCRATCWRSARG